MTDDRPETILPAIVTAPFRHLLVLIGLLGALGQTVAYAQSAAAPIVAALDAAGSSNCGGMSMPTRVDKSSPCHGPTLDCIAKMGCLPASALPDQPMPLSQPIMWRTIHYPSLLTPSTGLTVEPEVFPPIA